MTTHANPTAPILRGVASAALWLVIACAWISHAVAAAESPPKTLPADPLMPTPSSWMLEPEAEPWGEGASAASGGEPLHGVWMVPEVHPVAPPGAGARYGAPSAFAVAYDSNRHRAIGYMGDSGVWVLTLERGQERWEQLSTSGQTPGNLAGQSAVFDSQGDRLIIFGGRRPNSARSGETWSLDLTPEPSWSLLVPETAGGPAPRHHHAAIYDPDGRRMIVYGGAAGSQILDDLWALSLDGAPSWSRIEASGATPAARAGSVANHDPLRGELVLTTDRTFEVWALSLRGEPVWRQLALQAEFPSLSETSVILDPKRDRLVSFGGSGRYEWLEIGPAPKPHVFPLSGQGWGSVYDVAGSAPPPRHDAVSLLDPIGDRMIVFGGLVPQAHLDDTWALELSPEWRWRRIAPRPTRRSGYAIALDAAGGRLIASGGGLRWSAVFEFQGIQQIWNDETLWELDARDDRATWRALGSHERSRWEARTIFDPRAVAVIGLGGRLPSEFSCFTHGSRIDVPFYPGDAWRVELANDPIAGAPFSAAVFHEGHQLAIDRLRHRLLVYGGNVTTPYCDPDLFFPATSTVLLDRLLAIGLSEPFAVETLHVQGPGPGGRTYHHAFYDDDRDRMMLFDGGAGELWALDLAGPLAWTLLGSTARFGDGYRAVYDPVRERVVVIVGGGALQAWAVELDGSSTRLSPGGAAIVAGSELRAEYDEVRDRIVIHGPRADEVAYLRFGTPLVRVAVELLPGRWGDAGSGAAGGLLGVAILGGGGFDVSSILPGSVTLGGALAVRPGFGDGLAVTRDVDRDGLDDLVLWFRISEIDMSTGRVRLEGLTTEKVAIRGFVSIAPRALRAARADSRVAPGVVQTFPHDVDAMMIAGSGGLGVSYSLPRSGSPVFRLLDVGGRRVREWRPGALGAGRHELRFDVTGLASGVYFLKVQEGTEVVTARIAVVR